MTYEQVIIYLWIIPSIIFCIINYSAYSEAYKHGFTMNGIERLLMILSIIIWPLSLISWIIVYSEK